MGSHGRMLALVGGGFLGSCMGALLGGCLGYVALREAVPAAAFKQHQSDWFGGLIDTGNRTEAHVRNLGRTAAAAAAGGLAGLLSGIAIASRFVRRARRDQEPPLHAGNVSSAVKPGAAPHSQRE